MTAVISRRSVLLWTLAAVTAAVAGPAVQAQTVDLVAVEKLRRMTEYTAQLQQFSVHTDSTLEYWLPTGQRLDHDVAADVTLRRPNKLWGRRTGELVEQEFVYDGKTLTFHHPSAKVYAVEPAPGTVEELLDYTREELGLVIPVEDLVYRNAFAILMQDVNFAAVVGKAEIGGVMCDHLVFGRPDINFQIWIAEGERPLPYKYVVTDPRTPPVSTVTVMSDWNLSPGAADAEFEFEPPADAQRIDFMPVEATTGFGP